MLDVALPVAFCLGVGLVLTLIHELGHATAVVLLTQGRAEVTVGRGKRYAGLRFGRVRIKLFALDAGGQCDIPPTASARDVFLIALAGPAASSMVAAPLVGAVLASGGFGASSRGVEVATVIAVAVTVLNLVPLRVGGQASDGLVALETWQAGHDTSAWRVPRHELQLAEMRERPANALVLRTMQEATSTGTPWVGTEHLLLGIAAGDDDAARALTASGFVPERLRERLQSAPGARPGSGPGAPTPAYRRALDRSWRHLSLRGDADVLPEHVLLSLLEGPDGDALSALEGSGATADAVRRRLLRLMAHAG